MENIPSLNERICLYCGESFKGRSDKKFCDTQCRNSYNNKVNRIHELRIIEINKILRKNRSILNKLCPMAKSSVPRKYLELSGFDFEHFTNLYRSPEGYTYYIVYDHGYRPVSADEVLIIFHTDDTN